jgi:GxxExxY protein
MLRVFSDPVPTPSLHYQRLSCSIPTLTPVDATAALGPDADAQDRRKCDPDRSFGRRLLQHSDHDLRQSLGFAHVTEFAIPFRHGNRSESGESADRSRHRGGDQGTQGTRARGLLESVYIACLVFELRRSGLSVKANVPLPVEYDEVRISIGFRLDIVVDDYVILELKSVKKLANIHSAKALTNLKLSGYPVALLMNFNVTLLTTGVQRLINPHPAKRFVV